MTTNAGRSGDVTSLRLPDDLRAELNLRVASGEAGSMGDLIRQVLTEHIAVSGPLPYDHGEHGKYLPELNALRQAAADALRDAIEATVASDPTGRRRVPTRSDIAVAARADLARKAHTTAQAEYTMALIDYNESRRHD